MLFIRILIFCISIASIISSCSPILGIYGIHPPRKLSEKKICKSAKRLSIPQTELFQIDTNYFSFLSSFDTIQIDSLSSFELIQQKKNIKAQIKNHIQPLQALYFNKAGELVSFQINCYAGGFPNLKWDRNEIFKSFPPKLQAPLDSLVTPTSLSSLLIPLSKTSKLNSNDTELVIYDYVVYVFWSKFMGRQNKHFIRFIQENHRLYAKSNVKFLYVNMDNSCMEADMW